MAGDQSRQEGRALLREKSGKIKSVMTRLGWVGQRNAGIAKQPGHDCKE